MTTGYSTEQTDGSRAGAQIHASNQGARGWLLFGRDDRWQEWIANNRRRVPPQVTHIPSQPLL